MPSTRLIRTEYRDLPLFLYNQTCSYNLVACDLENYSQNMSNLCLTICVLGPIKSSLIEYKIYWNLDSMVMQFFSLQILDFEKFRLKWMR